jgi:ElaB/YqjD/DUF883 family membrane-anchored ribosome-binding protein
MANTEFDPAQIAQVATKQNEEMAVLRNELKQLHAEVQDTLANSTSLATKSLENVYSQWFGEVDQFIVDRTNLLSTTMTDTAGQQVSADEENASTISAIASFLR